MFKLAKIFLFKEINTNRTVDDEIEGSSRKIFNRTTRLGCRTLHKQLSTEKTSFQNHFFKTHGPLKRIYPQKINIGFLTILFFFWGLLEYKKVANRFRNS